MQSGKLDQRITVKRGVSTTQNTFGEDIASAPDTVGVFWANVGFLLGRELYTVQQRFAEARYKICIRRQPGIEIRRKDIITWNSLTLDVLDIQGPGTRMPEWTIIAKDYVA